VEGNVAEERMAYKMETGKKENVYHSFTKY